jgi:hypothetical protein
MTILPHLKFNIGFEKALNGVNRFLTIVLVCAGLLVLDGCSSKAKRPAGVLSRREMVDILEEIYIAEAKISRMGIHGDSSDRVFEIFRKKVAEKTNVSDSVFQRSFNYYKDQPQDLELIYTALVDSLNLREQRSSVAH